MRESRVGVGVIGVGGISAYKHLPGLRSIPQAEIVALCDSNADLVHQRGAEYGVTELFTDYHDLLRLSSVDAVIVATPTVLHRPIALAAFEAGKHALVEKQLAMDYAEAVQMYEAARRSGRNHMTAFTYRFVPAMRYLRHLLAQGVAGVPRHIRVARFQDWPEVDIGWRQKKALAGSGEVGDMGAHRIDFCHDLVGPIARVCGLTRLFVPERGNPPVAADVEDFAAFIAEFAPGVGVDQGTVAVFDLSKVTKGRQFGGQALDEFEVYGTEGTLIYHLHRPHEVQVGKPDGPLEAVPVPREFLTYPGATRDPYEGDPTTTFRFDEDLEFIQSILEGRPSRPSFYDGMRCQAVVDAVLQSAAERRWVDVADVPPVRGRIAAQVTEAQ
ncbi:MAG TPA: Gfo/Idh/MocA family oxidoreductase [Chloroflexota bacterium]|nr:Gfo/Idh/MocA family oxidoreductase [Chloroflexota bacterium]